jgi:hypothetical protein
MVGGESTAFEMKTEVSFWLLAHTRLHGVTSEQTVTFFIIISLDFSYLNLRVDKLDEYL